MFEEELPRVLAIIRIKDSPLAILYTRKLASIILTYSTKIAVDIPHN